MPAPNQDSHGIGSIITRINEEYIKKYGDKFINVDGGSVFNTYINAGEPINLFQSQSVDITANVMNPYGFMFLDDGTKLYATSNSANTIDQYSVATPYDISTLTWQSQLDISAQHTYTGSIESKPFGDVMFTADSGDKVINEWSLGTAYDITTASFVKSTPISLPNGNLNGMWLKREGDIGICTSGTSAGNSVVIVYDLSTTFDWDTAVERTRFTPEFTQDRVFYAAFYRGGDALIVTEKNFNNTDNGNAMIYDLATPYDITTRSESLFVQNIGIENPTAIEVSADNSKMVFCNNDTGLAEFQKEISF